VIDDLDPHAAYKSALRNWYVDFRPTVLFTERRVTSERKRLTGRLDLGIVYNDDGVVVDLKTGANAPSHGIQVAGYADLANDDPALTELLLRHTFGPWNRAILYLRGDGKYDWRGPMRLLQDGPQDAYLFRSAHALVAWRYDHGLLSVIDGPPYEDDEPRPSPDSV
jgi:hypothetical protein